ncbi:hypothetical protein HDU83_008053 [Entophlyctis luteolus]|nr:hypothetical protein HDU83_008053 [Entophlyctis luteolus]KAJ3394455.1 hypothetical protein HDU84_008451 [Entophlyctis sp. JEL0112]
MVSAQSPRNILVAVDESSHSIGAFSWALDNIATNDGDHVTVVVCIELESDREAVFERTKTLIRAIADPGHLNVKYAVQVLLLTTTNAGAKLCQLVDEVSPAMLVLGSAGKSHLQGMLVGSVSQHCIMHANCPVIVARVMPADELRAQDLAKKPLAVTTDHAMWV